MQTNIYETFVIILRIYADVGVSGAKIVLWDLAE